MNIRSLSVWVGALTLWVGSTGLSGAAEGRLDASRFVRIAQSSDAAATNVAARALDGATNTFSLTANTPGSFWTAELGRPYALTRIEIVNRGAPNDAELSGQALRLFNLDDQQVYETNLTNPGPGSTLVITLPTGFAARTVRIGPPDGQANGAGNYRVGFAEVRLIGTLDLPYGPGPFAVPTNAVSVRQSSEYPGFPAGNAVDGNTGNFTHTANVANGFWMSDFGRALNVDRVEIVNRLDCCAIRLAGLVARLFDAASNSVWSAALPNPGLGGVWTGTPPAGTSARWLRVGLENGQPNGDGNFYVTVAEARVFSGVTNVLVSPTGNSGVVSNLASLKPSTMLRLIDSVPPSGNANDDNYSTQTATTTATVDGYWETDLGATYALYGVRSIAAAGITYRLTNTIVRLYNEAHESVFARKVTGLPDVFDTDLNGPVFARYVRVGLEDKQRTDPAGGIEFYIGWREVEVFGRPTNNVGIRSFTSSTNRVAAGETVTLSWNVEDVRRVEIHPGIGSVGAYTGGDGAGSFTVTVTNSTEFVLVASNAAGIFSSGVSVTVTPEPHPVRLSEFVAENKYSIKDGNGDASDWIELRNTGNAVVNLAGYGLSDDPAEPMKWVFPATSLAAHSTVIVFASGRNTPFDGAENLHANFRLSKTGGALVLSSPDTNTIDVMAAHPEQETDLAYGRDLEGQWTFLEPTPGEVNSATTYLGWLKQLDFSHPRGFHETSFDLTLTNNSPGSTIVYSLDGSPPTVPYAASLLITNTKAVRAQPVRPGYKSPRPQTKTFIFINDVIASPLMNTAITRHTNYAPRLRPGLLSLPTICLSLPGEPEYEEKEGSVEIIWPDGRDGSQINAGVSRFGNAWTKFAKRSFRIKCRSRYGEARWNVPLFAGFDRSVLAQTSFDEIDLRSGSQDMVERGFYMAGRFVEDSMLDMGSLNPHGRFVHVYVNGVYWGQYDARELLVDTFLADYLGGQREDYLVVRGNDNVGDDFTIGAPEPPVIAPWDRVISLKNSYHAVRPYLDVSHMLDFLMLWNYGNCESEYRSCGTVDAGSGFKFWIADADGFLRTGALGQNRTARIGPGGVFGALMTENHSDFKALFADRIYRHFFNGGALTPAALDARLGARMNEIKDSLILECARWNYRTPTNWVSEANLIRSNLFPVRSSQLLGMMRTANWYPTFDPPTFNQYGGVVSNGFQPVLTSVTGTIYYTLDGTDPRLPGGGVSPSALIWTPGAVTIANEVVLSVRVRNASGQWSALSQPRYVLPSQRTPTARDLLVTEIHYRPADSDNYGFIELYNASADPLNLSGVQLSDAVRFLFPNGTTLQPGQFALVVENAAAFAQRYQNPASPYSRSSLNVIGQWTGGLANDGETLSLLAFDGTILSSVRFRSGGEWPGRAGGSGSSLELGALPNASASDADVRAYVTDAANWTSSSRYHGSPGFLDDFTSSVRINEVVSHSLLGEDWIELYNAGDQPFSLAGVTLTDNLAVPNRYAFANDDVIGPGQYLVRSATELGFAFGEMGELAALLQVSGTNIVRFHDTVDFPAAAPEVPFGVFTRLDGQVDFTELTGVTPDAPNVAPRIGPLVISEILSQAAPGRSEFIELTSLTDGPIALYDPARPTNVWSITGVGDFLFPAGTVIAPFATVIVCATNPTDFRAQYGLSASVPVFGPWPGNLDSDGEIIRLLRPGEPQTNGLPLYRADHVTYRARHPWPPSTPGISFQKTTLDGYGNDSAHWAAAVPTPGTSLLPGERPVIVSPPRDQRSNIGASAAFSVVASGEAPLLLQWRFRGTSLPGATNATLVLTNLQITDAGQYDVAAFGRAGSTISTPATLVVVKPPTITQPPVTLLLRPGSNGVFSVTAVGTGPLRYQWLFNGVPITGATNLLLSIVSATLDMDGDYTVAITDDLGTNLSPPTRLAVMIDPVILQHPLSQTLLPGGSVTFSVTVAEPATLPIGYRWRRGSNPLASYTLNSRTSFFTVTNLQPPSGNWTVVVTNAAKPFGVLSSVAILTFLSDTNANDLPDNWESDYFGPGNSVLYGVDSDGDGLTNGQEYLAGTDPTDPTSCLRVEIPAAGGSAQIRFGATSNHTYSVQFSDGLDGRPWTKLADVVARTTNRIETIVDLGWTTNRFYRAVVPMQP